MNAKLSKVPLAHATEDQLREFATNVLGLPIEDKDTASKLRSAIKKAWEQPDILVAVAEPPPAVEPSEDIAADVYVGDDDKQPGDKDVSTDYTDSSGDEVFVIQIDKTDTPGGDQPVWVCVNGRGLFIPRGKQAPIRARFWAVLQNAIKTIYHHNDRTNQTTSEDVPAYPIRLISGPHPAGKFAELMAKYSPDKAA